jgi:hypothetical protein
VKRLLLLVLFVGLLMGVQDRVPDPPEVQYLAFSVDAGSDGDLCMRSSTVAASGAATCAGPGTPSDVGTLTLNAVHADVGRTPYITSVQCHTVDGVGGGHTLFSLTPEWVYSNAADGAGTDFDTPEDEPGAAVDFGSQANIEGSWVASGPVHLSSDYAGPQAMQMRIAITGTSSAATKCVVAVAH